jgi:hypothetical protein
MESGKICTKLIQTFENLQIYLLSLKIAVLQNSNLNKKFKKQNNNNKKSPHIYKLPVKS